VAVTVGFSTQRAALQSTGAQNFLQPQPIFTILNSVRNVRQTYLLLLIAPTDKNPA